jgi:hypothetical protein
MADEENTPAKIALLAVPKSRKYISDELRHMAAGIGEYDHLARLSPWAVHVWRAAAAIIESAPAAQKERQHDR